MDNIKIDPIGWGGVDLIGLVEERKNGDLL
jgi:hypothetical protein